jgi:heat shock protein HtpX
VEEDRVTRQLDVRRLKQSSIGIVLFLIISAEAGVALGGLVGLPLLKPTIVDNARLLDVVQYGMAMVAFLMVGGVVVPIFGLTMGFIGASGARHRAIRDVKASILDSDHPLTRAVHGLAHEFGLNVMPWVGIYPDADINAFAAGSGRKKAVVCFSQGLLDRSTGREILAIAGHELAHIANNDMRRMQFAWSFQNALTWYMLYEEARALARWLLGTLGELLIFDLSRRREYWADATAAALLGKQPMIEALQRLKEDPIEPPASRLAYARLMIRSNPKEWFSTHPTIADRIDALERELYIKRLPFRSTST